MILGDTRPSLSRLTTVLSVTPSRVAISCGDNPLSAKSPCLELVGRVH
jgi:hypothetical protein